MLKTDTVKRRSNGTIDFAVSGGGAIAHYDALGKFIEKIVWPNGATAYYHPEGRELKLEWPETRRVEQ